MLGVVTGFAVIGVVILVGYLLGRSGVLGEEGYVALNRMAFYAATPALLFTVLARTDMEQVFSPHMAVAVLSFAGASGLYLLVSALFLGGRRRPLGETVVGMAGSAFANNNNIGLPLTLFVLGDVHYAAIVLVMQSVLVTPVLLTVLSAASGERVTARSVALGVVSNPIIIGAVLGLAVGASGIELPEPVMAPLDLIASAAIPVVLIAFGVSFVGRPALRRGSGLKRVAAASVIKVAVMPVLAYLLGRFVFGLDGVALFAAVLCAGLPTGQMVFSYAARYGVGVGLARDVVLVTTIACVPAITIIALLLA